MYAEPQDVAENTRMRQASGCIGDPRAVVWFLYVLMRDHLPPGKVEEIMRDIGKWEPATWRCFTNGWLAQHAQDIAERLGVEL